MGEEEIKEKKDKKEEIKKRMAQAHCEQRLDAVREAVQVEDACGGRELAALDAFGASERRLGRRGRRPADVVDGQHRQRAADRYSLYDNAMYVTYEDLRISCYPVTSALFIPIYSTFSSNGH